MSFLTRPWRNRTRQRFRTLLPLAFFGILTTGAAALAVEFTASGISPVRQLTALVRFFNPPSEGVSPSLAREYIYAGGRLIAIEDGGGVTPPGTNLAVWRPSTGTWWIRKSDGSTLTYRWGSKNDLPVPADYDGDGLADLCTFRPAKSTWFLKRSSDGKQTNFYLGRTGDIPMPADYDGDGRADPAVWRPSEGAYYLLVEAGIIRHELGQPGDQPVLGDFDGDGLADPAVWSSSTYTLQSLISSSGKIASIDPRAAGDPVTADFDGDGRTDIAVRNGRLWTIRTSIDGETQTHSFEENGQNATHDFDGDGRATAAVWIERSGEWVIKTEPGSAARRIRWGQPGDIPVPARFQR